MLIKIVVLAGLAVFFFSAGEPGLYFLALAAIIPGVGLILAALLAVVLLIKTWYGSAAIVIGIIAFNLVGNWFLAKRDSAHRESPS